MKVSEEERDAMGAFAIYNDRAGDSTVISNIFIDEYMRDANDAQLKVYLYLVRMMSAGLPSSISDMADLFNHTEKEILRSLRYWERKGLLTLQTDSAGNLSGIFLKEPHNPAPSCDHQVISIAPMLSEGTGAGVQPVQPAALKEVAPAAGVSETPAGSSQISVRQMEEFQKSESNRQLMLVAEQYIGKPLSVREAKIICFIADQLHFSNELIDYLIEYCVGLGKKDFRYIEKVALNWAEEGISTASAAKSRVMKAPSERTGAAKRGRSSARSFQSFEKTSYNMEELEQQLLRNG